MSKNKIDFEGFAVNCRFRREISDHRFICNGYPFEIFNRTVKCCLKNCGFIRTGEVRELENDEEAADVSEMLRYQNN